MRNTSIFASLLALTAMLAVSCGGGDDELTKAIEELPRSALSTMVLTADEFGAIADGFEVDSDSGTSDNGDAAEDSMNPDDDEGDFDDAGRVTGYELTLGAADIGALLADGEGVMGVQSEVELFGTADEASADIARKLGDLDEFEGRNVDGLIMGPNETFSVSGLGDESGGIEFSGSVEGLDITVYVTVIYLRVGRLEAAVMFSAVDDQDLRGEAETAARKLFERIEGVALGDIDEDPVEIPAEQSEPAASEPVDRPEGVPDLASVAIRLSDLPDGFEVDEEGYEPPPDIEFSRDFGVADGLSTSIGRTAVVGLQNTVMLSEDVSEASIFLTIFEQLLTGDQGREFFASRFADGAGFEPEVLELQALPLDIGDEGLVILGLVETGVGDFAFAFMLVRVDRAVAIINVTALAGSFNLEDLTPLARLEEERLRTGPPG